MNVNLSVLITVIKCVIGQIAYCVIIALITVDILVKGES